MGNCIFHQNNNIKPIEYLVTGFFETSNFYHCLEQICEESSDGRFTSHISSRDWFFDFITPDNLSNIPEDNDIPRIFVLDTKRINKIDEMKSDTWQNEVVSYLKNLNFPVHVSRYLLSFAIDLDYFNQLDADINECISSIGKINVVFFDRTHDDAIMNQRASFLAKKLSLSKVDLFTYNWIDQTDQNLIEATLTHFRCTHVIKLNFRLSGLL